ncbi:MAG TPA: alpha/beta hydrolase [Actinomycetes bacterium]|nr:alpha/beta hydrolase [Actinomycetes bacterium]
MSGRPPVWHEERGGGAPILLLLHGLGATGEVWRGVCELAAAWPGTRVLVDFPGHGRSGGLPAYSYDAHASQLRALLDGRPGPVVVAGHSMGGYVGILLAGERYRLDVAAVVGLGIKVRWSEEEVEGLRRRAAQPVRWFGTREEAAARYLRSVGLDGVVGPADPMVPSGIVEVEGRWRLAVDPAANQVGPPAMERSLAAARAKVTLARGSGDQMVSAADLATLPAAGVHELAGLGHNAHVEDPATLWRLISSASRDAGVL